MPKWLFILGLGICMLACKDQAPPTDFELLLARQQHFDLLIYQAELQFGNGQTGGLGDVLIHADTIAFVGNVDTALIKVDRIIMAQNRIVCPGFIDVHAHGDPLRDAAFENFLAQGVTSISLGQDGYSAPFKDFKFWMDSVQKRKPNVHILPFIGHGTLREQSGVRYSKNPKIVYANRLDSLLKAALEAGAWGMSTGLEYVPGMYADSNELHRLARIVGEYDRMIMSHIRNEDDDQLEASIQELLLQGQYCKVHVSHMKSVYGKGPWRADSLLKLLDTARSKGIQITADVYPYMASFSTIGLVFPDWARPPNSFSKVRRLKRKQLEDYLVKRISKRNGPSATLFGTAPYAGKTLEQVSVEKGKFYADLLIDEIGPMGASAAYFIMDSSLQERLIQHDLVMIASDGSPTMRHPRGYGTAATIIANFVRDRNLLSYAKAIYKMTGFPAKTLGLKDRGLLKVGNKADILLFNKYQFHPQATFEHPHQLAEGMDMVWIEGELVWENGEVVTAGKGRVLRYQDE